MNRCAEKVVELFHLALDFHCECEGHHARAMVQAAVNILRNGFVAEELGWSNEEVQRMASELGLREIWLISGNPGGPERVADAIREAGMALDPNFNAARDAR